MRSTVGAAVLLGAGAVGIAAGPAPPIERDQAFTQRVDRAVDRGVAWLCANQRADGAFAEFPSMRRNTNGLAYMALRACGVAKNDPAAVSAWRAHLRDVRTPERSTYELGIGLLAFAAHGEPEVDDATGGTVRLSAAELVIARELADSLIDSQTRDGLWGASSRSGTTTDLRSTHFALLGLAAAARCGIDVDRRVWQRALGALVKLQQRRGPDVLRTPRDALPPDLVAGRAVKMTPERVDRARGWDACGDNPKAASAAMTAFGIGAVAICRAELRGAGALPEKAGRRAASAIADGLTWLGTAWRHHDLPQAITHTDAHAPPALRTSADSRAATASECYAAERACDLAGVEWMGGVDWYASGAEHLLRLQHTDGRWTWVPTSAVADPRRDPTQAAINAAVPVYETSLALLFLRRATAAVVRPRATTESTSAATINFDVAATLTGRDLEDFIDLVVTRWRRVDDSKERLALAVGTTSAGPRIIEPLLKRLAAGQEDTRRAAASFLRHATGETFGFDASADSATRDTALANWETWWMANAKTLRYDAAKRRLVTD
jgi:hypothetical protein